MSNETTDSTEITQEAGSCEPLCSAEGIYLYRTEDGEEIEFIPSDRYQTLNEQAMAEAIAEDDYDSLNPDLCDPSSWPRTYEIKCKNGWVPVSVDMEYSPNFYGKAVPNDRISDR